MVAWMLYAVLVAFALTVAAFMAERAAKWRGASTRWPWVASMLGSLAVPVIMACASMGFPDSARGEKKVASLVLSDATSIRTPLTQIHLDNVSAYGRSINLDALAVDVWVSASALMVLALSLGMVWVSRQKRGWRGGTLHGERVRIAPDTGPVVIGLIRPQIVVPEWLLQMSRVQQECALAHERSHLDARDPFVIAIAVGLLTLMPWNAVLWWQFSRLRRAMEMDCDARVLRGGCNVSTYCETLLHVGQQKSRHIPLLPAMSDSVSFLELRIRRMLRKPGKWVRLRFAACIGLSVGVAAAATQVIPPDASHLGALPIAGSAALDRYTGFYQISPMSLISVTRTDGGLSVVISGQMAAPEPFHLVSTGPDQFAVQGNDTLAVRFVMDASGRAMRLIATQSGRVLLDQPRTDEANAQRINETLAARIKAQKPFPGSEKALRLLLSDPDSGAGMSPGLAWERQQQKTMREAYLARIGAVQSYAFTGVNEFGADTYLVKRKNGEETIMLVVDEDGTLANAVRYSSMASPPKT